MTTLKKTLCLTVLAASTVLSACGGGGGGDKQDDSWIGKPTTNVPTTNKGGTGNGGGTPTPGGGNKDGGGTPTTGGDSGSKPTPGGDGGGTPSTGGDSGGKPTPGGDGGDSGGKPTPGGDGGDSGGKPTPGGDGGETVKDSNTIPITVEQYGPPLGYNVNQPYVSVTFCPPGSKDPAECKTVDRMLLDTGSVGVRVLASQIPAALQAKLSTQTGATNDPTGKAPLAECALFGSGFTWGSVKQADVVMGDKKAPALPIQIISDSSLPTIPTACNNRGGTEIKRPDISSVDGMGANGIVGIGYTERDSAFNYYYCPTADSCTPATVAVTSQVMHPVMAFATDNNGTIIRLPAVPATGQAKVTGELVFGIGTRANNALPATASIIALDAYSRYMTTYNGLARLSLIDSGTNTLMFLDETIPKKKVTNFYEPLTPITLVTQMPTQSSGVIGQKEVQFTIENSSKLFATDNTAFNNLGLYSSKLSVWGLPFFLGRDVYSAVNTAKIGGLAGPFVAF
ncbi:DUF3443 family protein [Paraburkholderia bonniea]|uniref:DUF3443 family protein n=1 Tax=Paraburkholderia bonniea TaxID=2152891 RepID=UPI002572CC8F|nr:DUF3443 family protein [Paraburkholderia bonniea]WJF89570.1 DUF3443 family protein [Paraburkholderia bonniea]WJF92884.1 DUF3443 family protein [Paraburkholderia bonniea]